MNFLSIFVLIPLLMLAGLWAARGIKAIRGVMVTGASALLIASVVLTFMYLGERSAGNTAIPCGYTLVCTASHLLLGRR